MGTSDTVRLQISQLRAAAAANEAATLDILLGLTEVVAGLVDAITPPTTPEPEPEGDPSA